MNYICSKFRKFMTEKVCSKISKIKNKKLMLLYVKTYNIDLLNEAIECNSEDDMDNCISKFKDIGEIFIRKRKNIHIDDNALLVSPVDSAIKFYKNVKMLPSNRCIKGYKANIDTLLDNRVELICKCIDKSIIIFRLSPQDYHRFHFPVDGYITEIIPVEGDYYTVKGPKYDVNKRVILIINSESAGEVVMVLIGALCVGSIILTIENNMKYKKGDPLGYFALGGSCIIMFVNTQKFVYKGNRIKVGEKIF